MKQKLSGGIAEVRSAARGETWLLLDCFLMAFSPYDSKPMKLLAKGQAVFGQCGEGVPRSKINSVMDEGG
jgi:hypothetical protein